MLPNVMFLTDQHVMFFMSTGRNVQVPLFLTKSTGTEPVNGLNLEVWILYFFSNIQFSLFTAQQFYPHSIPNIETVSGVRGHIHIIFLNVYCVIHISTCFAEFLLLYLWKIWRAKKCLAILSAVPDTKVYIM